MIYVIYPLPFLVLFAKIILHITSVDQPELCVYSPGDYKIRQNSQLKSADDTTW